MKCVATPGGAQKESRDVDNDGQPDTFVCATHPAAVSDPGGDNHGDNQNEEAGDANDGTNEQDDDCAKMGCSDLRKHGEDHGDQQGQSPNGGKDDDNDDGGDGDHNHEHQGADDMACPGSSGGADAGASAAD